MGKFRVRTRTQAATTKFIAHHTLAMEYWHSMEKGLIDQLELDMNVGGKFANRAAERKAIKIQKDAIVQLKKSFQAFEKRGNMMMDNLNSITETKKFQNMTDKMIDYTESLIEVI